MCWRIDEPLPPRGRRGLGRRIAGFLGRELRRRAEGRSDWRKVPREVLAAGYGGGLGVSNADRLALGPASTALLGGRGF
ncbi:MAG: hypothetical protein JRN42_08700 [Nitrososphaerota archaeon]|nr:hypothetical protein [Nitrososphaerota archaeon]